MDEEKIHAIGLWALRLLLVAGAIGCAIVGKNEAAGTIAAVAVASFLLLG